MKYESADITYRFSPSVIGNTDLLKYFLKTAKDFIELSQGFLILWISREYNFLEINYADTHIFLH